MAKRAGIMLCYPMEERRLLDPKFGWNFPKNPVIIQPKLDGERAHPIAQILPEPSLISSECNEIISVPHIIEAMREQKIKDEIDGELYTHGMDWSKIHSIVSRKSEGTIHPDAWKMQFHIFDVITDQPQLVRISHVQDLNLQPPLFEVPSYIAHSMKDIMYFYDRFKEEGYEGIIVRHLTNQYIRRRSRFVLKFKPKKTDHYRIIGFEEAISKDGIPKGMIGAIWCMDEEGNEFKVGAGSIKHEDRIRIFNAQQIEIGRFCVVQYQHLTAKSGVPRFGLALDIID
jgi:ATP-dependent DNA ligase